MICKNQKEAFAIVAERDDLGGFWQCVDTKKVLYVLKAHNFAHVKPKSKFPELKCDPDNIVIKSFAAHSNNDHHQNVKESDWLDR